MLRKTMWLRSAGLRAVRKNLNVLVAMVMVSKPL